MNKPTPETIDLLALTLIPGLGPVLIGRAVASLGSPREVIEASPERLRTVPGIGAEKARAFFEHRSGARDSAMKEFERAASFGATIVGLTDPGYPPLLREIQDPPPVLFVRGVLDPVGADKYPLAVVGSRSCTQYGREQTARFCGMIAGSGLTIISGGARGIDTAAHTAALQGGGRTIVVLGCGLAKPYPPENEKLFDRIVSEGRGAMISELPIDTPPTPENFPVRNRIISGMSLGVLLVEAAKGSGSLITARLAADDHGREVFAIPGRIDSAASEGVNELIKTGSAQLVTAPADIIAALEQPARHAHSGTHESRYAQPALFTEPAPAPPSLKLTGLSDSQKRVHDSLERAMSIDDIAKATGFDAARLRADLTILELRRVVVRSGSTFERVK